VQIIPSRQKRAFCGWPTWGRAEFLVGAEHNVIWRRVMPRGLQTVAQHERWRMVGGPQAVVSCLHPPFRLPAADALLPSMTIDYETRPYEMAWMLHAWLAK
jgi:hypothetical protein